MAKTSTRPATHISVTTINYLGAVVFTVGCSVLVVNAVLSFMPFIATGVKLPKSVIYVEGALSLMSNALFLCGSLFAFVQVINAKRNDKNGEENQAKVSPGKDVEEKECGNAMTMAAPVDPPAYESVETTTEQITPTLPMPPPPYTPEDEEEYWRVIPTSHDLWTYYIHEMGFVATSIFLCSSLVYFGSSVASIITIATTGEIAIWIRYPQLVAAVGFAAASIMMMLQAQRKFWQPAFHSLRWHINFLNLVGSAGFIFCACFGLAVNVPWASYQFGLSYLWGMYLFLPLCIWISSANFFTGSWAFLFGSLIQWYKSLGKRALKRAKSWNNV